MNEDKLVAMHPRLYHMAELGSWPSIERHGLLSTKALVELFEVDERRRLTLTRERRPTKVTIQHSQLGSAVIRDNKPIHDSLLERCLEGMGKEDWYELLNGRVFFWLTRRQLETFLCARAYKSEEHTVLTLSTARLLERQRDDVRLSPINSGATHPGSLPPRGVGTFASIGDYNIERYSYRRPDERIRELAVINSVPRVADLVIDVEDTKCPR